MKKSIVILVALCLLNCSKPPVEPIKQGISGRVVWVEGNQMPGPDANLTEPEPIKRVIMIYEASKLQRSSRPPFHNSPPTRLVGKVNSNKEGYFQIGLPVGFYSVLVQEDEGLFASMTDGDGYLNPVKVNQGAVSDVLIKVDYKATY